MVRPIGVGQNLKGRLDDKDRLRLGGAAEGTVTQTSSMLRKKAIAQYSKDQAAKRLHELKVCHSPPSSAQVWVVVGRGKGWVRHTHSHAHTHKLSVPLCTPARPLPPLLSSPPLPSPPDTHTQVEFDENSGLSAMRALLTDAEIELGLMLPPTGYKRKRNIVFHQVCVCDLTPSYSQNYKL
jgi:hypothetical protein